MGCFDSTLKVNGTLSVLLSNLFRFRKETVLALRLEFPRFCTAEVREFFMQKWLQSEQGEITVDPTKYLTNMSWCSEQIPYTCGDLTRPGQTCE